MSYYASGNGTVSVKETSDFQSVASRLEAADVFNIEASGPESGINVFHDGNYAEDAIYAALNGVAGDVESGQIEFCGEDGSRWRIVFGNGRWTEECGTVVYENSAGKWPGKSDFTIIQEFPAIEYVLLKIDAGFQPFVAAWRFDKETGTWAQGHYFMSVLDAANYISNKTYGCSATLDNRPYYADEKDGKFEILANCDKDYPGVDIEFLDDAGGSFTRPRILFEMPNESCGHMRALLWTKPDSEDYTEEIWFENYFGGKHFERCRDCACLVEAGGQWACDECDGRPCADIEDCPEGLGL